MNYSLIVAFSFFLISILSGISLSQKFNEKLLFYKALLDLNRDLIASLNFDRMDLPLILTNNRSTFSNAFNELINCKIKQLYGENNKFKLPPFLSNKETVEICDYLNKLGKHDCKTSLIILKNYDEYFNKICIELNEITLKKGALYKKLAILIGLIVFVIVV